MADNGRGRKLGAREIDRGRVRFRVPSARSSIGCMNAAPGTEVAKSGAGSERSAAPKDRSGLGEIDMTDVAFAVPTPRSCSGALSAPAEEP